MYECGFFSYNVLYNCKKILIFTNIFLWVSNRFKVLNEEALSATFKTFSGMYKPHPYTISASYNNTNYHFRSFISLHKLYLLSSSDMKLLFSMTPNPYVYAMKNRTFRLPFIPFFHIRCNFRYIKMNGKLM